MTTKLLVTLRTAEDAERVRESGSEVLATYPDSLLVVATEAQQAALEAAGVETAELAPTPLRASGATFDFDDAVAADEAVPVTVDPHRTAYYVVQLIGPPDPAWLSALNARGAWVHGALSGFSLLIGLLPTDLDWLRGQSWVEDVTPYRPAMKVSPRLRAGMERTLDARDLERVELDGIGPGMAEQVEVQVEITVFPGESTADIAAEIRQAGGLVLREATQTVTAMVAPSTIAALAEVQGVQAILPHAFPELHNDRARPIIGVPVDWSFGTATLRGAGQIVAIADSGLDTGDPATIHADFAGRVDGIVSWPNQLAFASNDLAPFDDGPADRNSGHGTHVAGSVLGSGVAADAAGSVTVPAGVAPEARCFFQTVEQRVSWKTAAELIAIGVQPPATWPPPAVGLYGLPDDLNNLFDQAYQAGARIHTNSWGAAVAGEYNANASEVDAFVWSHRDLLVLFSAGNAGVDADASGVIDADSIGSPGTAKNCLTVGASENDRPHGSIPAPGRDRDWSAFINPDTGLPRWPALGAAGHASDDPRGMAAFSSRGPTDDGRIKPDVVAPGTNVLSVRSSAYAGANPPLWGDVPAPDPLAGRYCWSGGTSMSTPLVAGAAALIRQYLVEERLHAAPSGALMKAMICNGARPMPGQFAGEVPAGTNPVTGFGMVDVTGAVAPEPFGLTMFADEPEQAVETGQMRTFEARVADLAAPLKATLVWTDAPGLVGVGGLVNQLYLQVRRPDGTLLDGDLTPFPTATNNVQQLIDPAPVAGMYEIRVRGVNVTMQSPGAGGGPNPRQDFALAVSNVPGLALQQPAVVTTAGGTR